MPSSSDFTGRGWAFPLHLDSAGSFALSGGEQEIEEPMRLILGTSFGERPLRPEYGCGIHDLVFDTVDAALAGKVAAQVRASLARWEPRIDDAGVAAAPLPDQRAVPLRPPAGAGADGTLRLSAPRPEPVRVPAGTQVATRRLPGEEQIS